MNIYYKHAEELVKNASDLQRRVLIKHTAAILEEVHDKIKSRDIKLAETIEAASLAAKWMRWWIDQDGCECDQSHTCGKNERIRELEYIEHVIDEARKEEARKENDG